MNGRKEKKRFEWNKSCWKQRTAAKSKERTIEMVEHIFCMLPVKLQLVNSFKKDTSTATTLNFKISQFLCTCSFSCEFLSVNMFNKVIVENINPKADMQL